MFTSNKEILATLSNQTETNTKNNRHFFLWQQCCCTKFSLIYFKADFGLHFILFSSNSRVCLNLSLLVDKDLHWSLAKKCNAINSQENIIIIIILLKFQECILKMDSFIFLTQILY